jgi:hypothetical protein
MSLHSNFNKLLKLKLRRKVIMINIHVKYIVYDHSGSGVRHHHYSSQINTIKEFTDQILPDPTNATTYTVDGSVKEYFNGVDVPFAFMSVHGSATGNLLFTSPGLQHVTVGTSNIDILVVYAPEGGIGVNGGPGIWVDAFNVDTGNFSDSLDFIKVLTPPTPPDSMDTGKSSIANMEGEVSTIAAENIRANNKVDGIPFLEWKKIIPISSIINLTDIGLTQNETGEIWFAFYKTVQPVGNVIDVITSLMMQGIFVWTGDDTCGNGGHWIGPHGPSPFRISIKSDIISRLKPEQKKKLEIYIKEYPAIADSALTNITKVLDILKGVSDMITSKPKK